MVEKRAVTYPLLLLLAAVAAASAQAPGSIFSAILGEPGQATEEISTDELREILAARRALVLDARPHGEFAMGHIPGALNVAPRPGVSAAMYVSDVAEIGRLVGGDRAAPMILYCNGPHCGKTKRLGSELVNAGYTNVRRYQLGIPVWRALGGVVAIEPDGLGRIVANDGTAVLIDARERADYEAGTIATARNLPRSEVLEGKDVGEVARAKEDGRLPMEDHGTRIVVVGRSAADARHVAEALAREAFYNVSYFAGAFEEAAAALRK